MPPPILIPPIPDEALDLVGEEGVLLLTTGATLDCEVLEGAENFRIANCSNCFRNTWFS
ncbi:hypothetical protein QW060_17895 [Myroides ceti]|uniref:Uncharacterized protein n=1 Tax=Paenimyroides ceti TaxID=395087 RepID=A0ABT8CYW5_9FLAO|nr:hypothetical protein [Paenimyroides ceti]MDN3707277.1 hypothetical protein [Paenimyroides ceti]MDN3708951.1 hypothetical protein [Paenimyroides ceti]